MHYDEPLGQMRRPPTDGGQQIVVQALGEGDWSGVV
jgi:hypothetical protein